MGTVLGTFEWASPEWSLIERSAFWGFVVIWWEGCVIQTGRDTIYRETPFGGYRVRLTIEQEFWEGPPTAWRHDEIFENLYAMAPSDDTPISPGVVKREWKFFPSLDAYVVVVQFVPNNEHYRFRAFPFSPENAGSLNPPSDLPPLFYGDLAHPGEILPPIFC